MGNLTLASMKMSKSPGSELYDKSSNYYLIVSITNQARSEVIFQVRTDTYDLET